MYNHNYQVNYSTSYISFIKDNKYVYSSSVNKNTINSFEFKNFFPNNFILKHYYK